MTRLCVDCEYFTRAIMPTLRGPNCRCSRPVSTYRNLVSGEVTRTLGACPFDERRTGTRTLFGLGRERCGPAGKFFEPARRQTPPHSGSGAAR
jgi:hypothetical protein